MLSFTKQVITRSIEKRMLNHRTSSRETFWRGPFGETDAGVGFKAGCGEFHQPLFHQWEKRSITAAPDGHPTKSNGGVESERQFVYFGLNKT